MTAFLVIANAAAGTADEDVVGEACAVLGEVGEVERVGTGTPGELDDVLDRVDGRTLVVAGGDGSVHAVVDRLWQRDELTGLTLALVPLGTGNDLARSLDVPLDTADAARVVCAGTTSELDLVVDDDGGALVNAAPWGLGAEAARSGGELKDRLGKTAYPIGALVAAVREAGWSLRIEVDGEPLGNTAEPVLMAGLGNGRSIGGGTVLFPDPDPTGGLLDVVVSHATGPMERTAFANALRQGEHLERGDVFTTRGKVIRVTGEPVRHNTDGELTDEVEERTYRVQPGAWTLITP